MDIMLNQALEEFLGLLRQLIINLLGPHGAEWGNELKRFLRKERCWVSILIDRSKKFNLTFVGSGCTIWKGPADGKGLEGEEEQDARSLVLTEVHLSKIRFETMLRPGEISITGEERITRLKAAGHICFDAAVFHHLWENKHLIPESWKEEINGSTRYIFFDGSILRSSYGYRYVLYLYWDVGQWRWRVRWLGYGWDAGNPSAVLAN